MNLEIEELLLSCYISSVIKNVRKNIQKNEVKKVRFGDVSVKEYSLEEEYIEALEDTLLIDAGDNFHSLGMDEEFLADAEMPFNNWLQSSPSEKTVNVAKMDTDVDTYEDFLNGARKRLFLNLLKEREKDSLTHSPDRKKPRMVDSVDDKDHPEDPMETESESTFRCSTPETEHDDVMGAVLDDVLIFLRYHVSSYAIQAYLAHLTNQRTRIVPPHASTRNAQMFFDLCSKDNKLNSNPTQCSSASNRCFKSINENINIYPSLGISLAADILKQSSNLNTGDDDDTLVRNETSKNDFKDEQSYKRHIHDYDKQQHTSATLELPQNQCMNEAFLLRGRCEHNPLPLQEDLSTYLMPETDEPTTESMNSLHFINTLQPENILATGNLLPVDGNQREEITDMQRGDRELEESIHSLDLMGSSPSLFDDSSNGRNFAVQSPSVTRTTDDKINGRNENCELNLPPPSTECNINEMVSELMASQALRTGDMQPLFRRSHFNKFMKPVASRRNDVANNRISRDTSSDDGIVPQHSYHDQLKSKGDEISLHENCSDGKVNENRFQRCIGSDQKRHARVYDKSMSDDQTVPTLGNADGERNGLAHPSFQRNKADDSVVPFSHELFINSPSKIVTPQKIRLGLSKKSKVKATLHPYMKP